jgi:hypothetical protein
MIKWLDLSVLEMILLKIFYQIEIPLKVDATLQHLALNCTPQSAKFWPQDNEIDLSLGFIDK